MRAAWAGSRQRAGERGHDEDAEDKRGGKYLHAGQEFCEETAEGRCDEKADPEPCEEARAGNARLCHGKRRGMVLEQGECMRCVLVAVIGEALKPAAMGRGECGLDPCEVGIRRETDDEQDECEKIG